METDYKGRCPQCAKKDNFLIILNRLQCKHCGMVVGAQLSENVDVAILPTWNDISRWRKTVFKKEKKP